ncbi:HalOD1 output domain-containing protein [Haladaptatus sp. DFWS20]|uniref:HalOD1 output domain-containing protein n=1 Tax=Haladaptatus sp. DFWS20 TaxID=3403467 RepID=UPI003EBD8877
MSHIDFDWSRAEQPSIAIVEAITAVTGRNSTDIPPLYDSINPDALNALVTAKGRKTSSDVSLTFSCDGVVLTVTGDGTVTARPDDR